MVPEYISLCRNIGWKATKQQMAPKDEKQVDKIFAGWLDDLPPLSSKVRMSPFEENFSVVIAVSSMGVYVCSLYC